MGSVKHDVILDQLSDYWPLKKFSRLVKSFVTYVLAGHIM